MMKWYIFFIFYFVAMSSYPQSNIIVERTVIQEGILDANSINSSNSIVKKTFYDECGCLRQTLYKEWTPEGFDFADFIVYDSLNRKSEHYSFVPLQSSDGEFKRLDEIQSCRGWVKTYGYDQSVDKNIISVSGINYGGGTITKSLSLNNSESWEKRLLDIRLKSQGANGYLKCLTAESGSFFVSKTVDEDGFVHLLFKDNDGLRVLDRTIMTNGYFDTYYVYDVAGRLIAVLPPAISSTLSSGDVLYFNDKKFEDYGYYYEYDSFNRCAVKKLPGVAATYFVYDGNDKLIMVQDGNLRNKNMWLFYKYDALGRIIIEGTVYDSRGRSAIASLWENKAVKENFVGNIFPGYTDNCVLGNGNYGFMSVYYYDSYDYMDLLDLENSNYTECKYIKGLLTGKYEAMLNNLQEYRLLSFYYDDKQRVVCTDVSSAFSGKRQEQYGYDFVGNNLSKMEIYNDTISYSKIYNYDNEGRMRFAKYSISFIPNTAAKVSDLFNLSYDEYGRLSKEAKFNNDIEVNYNYYQDGSLREISSPDLFTEILCKSSSLTLPYDLPKHRNGLINDIFISQNGNDYYWHYDYDPGSRLTKAVMFDAYSYNRQLGEEESFAYDNMGNVTLVLRKNKGVDKELLSANYDGNKVVRIDNTAGDIIDYDFNGYDDMVSMDVEMTYDDNGNMISDLNRDIVKVKYNVLNLPDTIYFGNGNRIVNYYYANGEKAGTEIVTHTTPLSTPFDLVVLEKDPININKEIYNGSLSIINNIPGRIVDGDFLFNLWTIGTTDRFDQWYYTPYTYIRDHLGSVRLVCNKIGDVVQSLEYYPSGKLLRSSDDDFQPYKFTGKELIAANGLDWYDSKARMQEFHLPRFTAMDPLAEKFYSYSPYSYCLNNPLTYVDIDGQEPVYNNKGRYLGSTSEGFTGEVLIYKGNDNIDFNKLTKSQLKEIYKDDVRVFNVYDEIMNHDMKSAIWTNIVSHFEGLKVFDETFTMASIRDGKIKSKQQMYYGDNWETRYDSGEKPEIWGLGKYTYETTVENIASSVIVHEWYAHIMKNVGDRYKSHHLAYKWVMLFEQFWDKTTDDYKENVKELYNKYKNKETKK